MLCFWNASVLNEKTHFLMQQKNICTCQQLLHTHTQIASTDLLISGRFWSVSIPSWQYLQSIISLILNSSVKGEVVSVVRCGKVLLSAHTLYHSVLQQRRATENKAFHLWRQTPHLSLTCLTWTLDKSAYWLSKLQTLADTLEETFRCFTSTASSVWRYHTPRQ